MSAKVMFAVTIANAVVMLVLSGFTVWNAKLAGSRKSLRVGLVYAVISLGWVVSAVWADTWNWGLPTLLIVAFAITSSTYK